MENGFLLDFPFDRTCLLVKTSGRFHFLVSLFGSSRPEVFLGKVVPKICSKLTGEHQSQNVISIKLLCNVIEIRLWNGCSPVNLLHIFRTHFLKNTYGRLLLTFLSVTLCACYLLKGHRTFLNKLVAENCMSA